MVSVEEVVGEVEALGLTGRGGPFFEDGEYGHVGDVCRCELRFFGRTNQNP